MTALDTHLMDIYCTDLHRIEAHLLRCFPRACKARVADAIADAIMDAYDRPEAWLEAAESGGRSSIFRLLRTASWRKLRGQWRLKSAQTEVSLDHASGESEGLDPSHELSAQQLCAQVDALLPLAVAHFGGRRKQAFARALEDRLSSGDDDKTVAARHQVPRESVNRAKNWIRKQVAG